MLAGAASAPGQFCQQWPWPTPRLWRPAHVLSAGR